MTLGHTATKEKYFGSGNVNSICLFKLQYAARAQVRMVGEVA